MIVTPIKKKVLVAENVRESTTASGIIVEGAQGLGESKTGTVLAVGPDVTEVKVGDVIYLEWSKAKICVVEGSQRVIIEEQDIVAVVED
jgi:co-chaperonin GroES (HSP10)